MARVSFTIDDSLLTHLDRAARAAGLSRSAYVNRLVSNELSSVIGSGADPKVHDALRDFDGLFACVTIPGDSTAAIRAEHDARDAKYG